MIDLGYIDPHCPVDWRHPLNIGRVAWWLALPNPGWMGGKLFRDIVRGGKYPNDGTLTSMAIPGTATSGWGPTVRPGGWGELRFDGTNDVVQVADATHYRPTGAMSLAAWYYTVTAPDNAGGVGALGVSPQRGFVLGADSDGTMKFFIAPTSTTLQSASASNTTGVWIRYVGVYIPSVSITIYANGRQVAQNTTTIAASQYQGNGLGLQIGNRGDSDASSRFNGSIDDISIWSRALSPAEVWADYQLSRQGYPGVLNRWGMVARDYTDVVIPPGSGFRVIVNAQPLSQLVGGGLARG